MNRLQAPLDRPLTAAGAMDGGMIKLKTLGVGVIVGFTIKGLITTALMVMVMLEFVHY